MSTPSTVLSGVCNVILFFFNDTATTEIYTLSLHDALPILFPMPSTNAIPYGIVADRNDNLWIADWGDRKSTRLNSSHLVISYAVFCLKKKNPLRRLAEISPHHLRTLTCTVVPGCRLGNHPG